MGRGELAEILFQLQQFRFDPSGKILSSVGIQQGVPTPQGGIIELLHVGLNRQDGEFWGVFMAHLPEQP